MHVGLKKKNQVQLGFLTLRAEGYINLRLSLHVNLMWCSHKLNWLQLSQFCILVFLFLFFSMTLYSLRVLFFVLFLLVIALLCTLGLGNVLRTGHVFFHVYPFCCIFIFYFTCGRIPRFSAMLMQQYYTQVCVFLYI